MCILVLKTVFIMTIICAILVTLTVITIVYSSPSARCRIEPITTLVANQYNNNLLVKWKKPVYHGSCSIFYNLTLKDSQGHILGTTETKKLEYEFENLDLIPCTLTGVTVTPLSKEENNNIVTGEAKSIRHFGHVGSVENLLFSNEDSFKISWNPPKNSLNCKLRYQLIFVGENKEVIIDKTEYPLQYEPCIKYNVTVTPLVQYNNSGESTYKTYIVPPDPQSVRDLLFSEENKRFQWTEPNNIGNCSLSYDVYFENDFFNPIREIQECTNFSFPLIYCTRNTITVTAVVGGSRAPAESRTHYVPVPSNPQSVRDLLFSEENKRFQWTEPNNIGNCFLSYDVYFENDFGTINRSQECTNFSFPLKYCTSNTITVTAVVGGSRAPAQSRTHHVPVPSNIGSVRNLSFNNSQLSWEKPLNISVCPVIYTVIHESYHDKPMMENVTEEIYNTTLLLCSKNNFTVFALLEDIEGKRASVCHQVDPRKEDLELRNVSIYNNTITWMKPQNSCLCDITYKINVMNSFGEKPDQTRNTFYELQLIPCTTNNISVFASVNYTNGSEFRTHHTAPRKLINRLTIEPINVSNSINTMNISSVPMNENNCPITHVKFLINNYELRREVTDNFYRIFVANINFTPESNYTVKAILYYNLDVISVESNNLTFTTDLEIPQLQFNNEVLRFEWSRPIQTDLCSMIYQVKFSNQFTIENKEVKDNYFKIKDVPCSLNRISVSAVVDKYVGPVRNSQHDVPLQALDDPILDYTLGSTSVDLHIFAQPVNENACVITTVSIAIRSENQPSIPLHIEPDNMQRNFTATIEPLLPNTKYTAIAFFLSDQHDGDSGPSSITFITNPIAEIRQQNILVLNHRYN